MEILLKIGGVYNMLCALLHIFFPKMFQWEHVLMLLSEDKRPLIEHPLYIMNWCMFTFWIILAYIPFMYSSQLLKPGLGRTLLGSITLFWIVRIFVLQPVYIGLQDPTSWSMVGFFLIGLLLFAIPFIKSLGEKKITDMA